MDFRKICTYKFRITSRKYYNFMNDAHRVGETVKPFTSAQSWKLLMKFLGPDMMDQDRRGLITGTEERAARDLLHHLGGVSDRCAIFYLY